MKRLIYQWERHSSVKAPTWGCKETLKNLYSLLYVCLQVAITHIFNILLISWALVVKNA